MTRLQQLRLPLLLLIVLVIQHTTLGSATIYGIHPDLVILIVCATAVAGGREIGTVVGFIMGLLVDAYLVTPFGLSSMVFSISAYILGETEKMGKRRRLLIDCLFVGIGSAAIVILTNLSIYLLGSSDPLHRRLLLEVGVVTLVNLILAPVALALAKFAVGERPAERPVAWRR